MTNVINPTSRAQDRKRYYQRDRAPPRPMPNSIITTSTSSASHFGSGRNLPRLFLLLNLVSWVVACVCLEQRATPRCSGPYCQLFTLMQFSHIGEDWCSKGKAEFKRAQCTHFCWCLVPLMLQTSSSWLIAHHRSVYLAIAPHCLFGAPATKSAQIWWTPFPTLSLSILMASLLLASRTIPEMITFLRLGITSPKDFFKDDMWVPHIPETWTTVPRLKGLVAAWGWLSVEKVICQVLKRLIGSVKPILVRGN